MLISVAMLVHSLSRWTSKHSSMTNEITLDGPSFVVGHTTYVRAPQSYLDLACCGTPVAVRQRHFRDADPAWAYIVCRRASVDDNFVVYFVDEDACAEVPRDWVYVSAGTMQCRHKMLDVGDESAGASPNWLSWPVEFSRSVLGVERLG